MNTKFPIATSHTALVPQGLTRISRLLGASAALAVAVMGTMPLKAQAPPTPRKISVAQHTTNEGANSQNASGSEVIAQGYSVEQGKAEQLATRLQALYGNNKQVRIAADPRTKQLVVMAPREVQAKIAAEIKQLTTSGAKEETISSPAKPSTKVPASVPTTLSLRHIQGRDAVREIEAMGSGKLRIENHLAEGRSVISIPLGDAKPAQMEIDHIKHAITLKGTNPEKALLAKLVQSMDRAPIPAGETRLVSLNTAKPSKIQEAMELIRKTTGKFPDTGERKQIGDFLTMVFQPGENGEKPMEEEENQNPPKQQPPAAEPPAAEEEDEDDDNSKIGTVQIEFLDGLDVMVLRGKKKDVARVQKLIDQIENLSVQTQPEVEIYNLKHLDGRSLSELINRIYDTVFSARQGRVSITPLVHPNALLLIGRKENLGPVRELIEKLDQPVNPDARIQIFRLKNVSVIDAEATLRNFFSDPNGSGAGVTAQPGGAVPGAAAAAGSSTNLAPRASIYGDYRSNTLIVQASPRDLSEVERLIESIDVESGEAVNEVRIFRLKNTLATELAPVIQEAINGQRITGGAGQQQQQQQQPQQGTGRAQATRRATALQFLRIDAKGEEILQSGILADTRITADTRGNALVVSGPSKSMPLIGALIDQLDSLPSTEAQIKVFSIVNGDAQSLVTMLQSLFGQPSGQNQQGQGGGGGGGPAGANISSTGSGENTIVPLRFSVDQRTNTIIASGNAGDLKVVYQLLVRLDEGDIRGRITTVYRLRNSFAPDVANALNQFLTNQRQVNQQNPNLVSPFEQIEREVIVVPEIVSNSLIVSATPRFHSEMQRVVEQLDRRNPMVVIQVLLAEITLGDIDQFGVELGLQDALLFDRGIGNVGFPFVGNPLGNNSDATSLATRKNVGGQGFSNLGIGRSDTTLGYGGMVLSASSESVSLLVRALQQSKRLQVLSRPQIQTLDNQPAYIQVGARVPRITSSNLTTFGTTNSTTLENVGVILGVTPRTSPDGVIVMEVNAEKSELGPIAEGIPISVTNTGEVIRSPQIKVTNAETTVSARSGQTVILGGLITKSQTELTRRVPYLGDIPVLGRLFRFDSVQVDRTELLIILTPYIVDNEERQAWLGARESQRMNWCLADVANLHGEVPFAGSRSAYDGAQSPVIFPDDQPGMMMMPQDAPFPGGTLPSPQQPFNPALPDGTPENADPRSIAPPNALPTPPGQLPPFNPTGSVPSPARGPRPEQVKAAAPPALTQQRAMGAGPYGPPAMSAPPANIYQPVSPAAATSPAPGANSISPAVYTVPTR